MTSRSDRRRGRPSQRGRGGKRTAGKRAHDEGVVPVEPPEEAHESAPSPAPRASRSSRRTTHGPQRRTMPGINEDLPSEERPGWRSTRRTSRTGKQARRAAKSERVREKVGEKVEAAGSLALRIGKGILGALLAIAVAAALLWGAALAINAFARWNAKRMAEQTGATLAADRARENIVIIGVKDKQAIGFVALKAERSSKRVLGIAIPDGAFMEVPGQGFERVGDSFSGGPTVSRDTVANFLSVPFLYYLVVDADAYQALVTKKSTDELIAKTTKTNMSEDQQADLEAFLGDVSSKDVWILPLPVKPIAVGDERYFEPQRDEIADIVGQWWGVQVGERKEAVRVIVYNGVGTPGVAGKAAQQLIREGFRVVDSRNADNFDHKTTQVLLYHGTQEDAEAVQKALGGVGEILVQSTPQDVADVIVVIGADYVPPAGS